MGVEGGGGSSGCCLSSWRLLLPGRETVVVGAGSAVVGPLVLTNPVTIGSNGCAEV